jgi:hypothetical protein
MTRRWRRRRKSSLRPGAANPVVVVRYVNVAGVAMSGATSVNDWPLGAAGTTAYSDGIAIGGTEFHALGIKYEAANALSTFDISLQARLLDGTWSDMSPAVSVTLAGASGTLIREITLPVCDEVRIKRAASASYATTITVLDFRSW